MFSVPVSRGMPLKGFAWGQTGGSLHVCLLERAEKRRGRGHLAEHQQNGGVFMWSRSVCVRQTLFLPQRRRTGGGGRGHMDVRQSSPPVSPCDTRGQLL
ncbi:hypothetical protein AAFF_G00323740 [Aldrovandia affinis]|uniref:Uncharacterized protein n=1 Tax=Aldrovandia affinis TaxID=143900 RepID=A0AAD7R6Z0_9TELE|nr:hypothetical protein AAFF_G00323740 [Aldrovandia affinis]